MKIVVALITVCFIVSLPAYAIIIKLGEEKITARFEDSDLELKKMGRDLQIQLGQFRKDPEALRVTIHDFDKLIAETKPNVHLINVRGQKTPVDEANGIRGDVIFQRSYHLDGALEANVYTLSGAKLATSRCEFTFDKLADQKIKMTGSCDKLKNRDARGGSSSFEISDTDPIYFELK
jgi:hypothetical protein